MALVPVAPYGSMLGELADGVHDEMFATLQAFCRDAAAACAEVCLARLRLLQTQLQRSFEEDSRRFMSGGSPLGSRGATTWPGTAGESRHVGLVRSIRRRLEVQGDSPESFLRARASGGQGLMNRVDFIASVSSLNVGATVSELNDLFSTAINSSERDNAVVDELVMALEEPRNLGSSLGGGAGGALASVLPEAERVINRVRSAVGRSGRPFDEIFRGFCRSSGGAQGLMSRTDLARVLSTFEPGLEPEVVTRLWRVVVPDGAAGLDYSTFCTWFCPGGRSLSSSSTADAHLLESSFTAGSAMLQQLLDMTSPKNGGRMSPHLPLNGHHTGQMLNTAFHGSTLHPEHQDWHHTVVRRSVSDPHMPAPLQKDELAMQACLHRLHKALSSKGLTFSSAFVLYDKNMERAVMLEGMVAACQQHGMPLSRQEIETLFQRLSRSSQGGKPPRIYFEDLDASMQRIPEPMPDLQWAKDLIKAVDKITRAAGTPLEVMFKQMGKDSVQAFDVQGVLSKHAHLSDAQWASLLPLIDKNLDGTIPWLTLLKWSGVATAPDPAPAAAPAALPALPAPAAATALAMLPALPASPAPAIAVPFSSAPLAGMQPGQDAALIGSLIGGVRPPSAAPLAAPMPGQVVRPLLPGQPVAPLPQASPLPPLPGATTVAVRPPLPAAVATPLGVRPPLPVAVAAPWPTATATPLAAPLPTATAMPLPGSAMPLPPPAPLPGAPLPLPGSTSAAPFPLAATPPAPLPGASPLIGARPLGLVGVSMGSASFGLPPPAPLPSSSLSPLAPLGGSPLPAPLAPPAPLGPALLPVATAVAVATAVPLGPRPPLPLAVATPLGLSPSGFR